VPQVDDDRIGVLKRRFEIGGAGNGLCLKIQDNTSSVKTVRWRRIRTCGIYDGTAEVVGKIIDLIVGGDG
jgi:hypothetical protein